MTSDETLKLLPGDYIFREGEFGQTAYLIESGKVELVKYTGDKHTVLVELEKGALFGEMAIIESSPRSASARAVTDCTVRIITEERLKKHLASSPNVSLEMMRRLAGYARSANERLTKDAFSDSTLEEDNSRALVPRQSSEVVDPTTARTLREFNDDLDEFSKISPKKPLTIAGIIIILMVVTFGVWASIAEIDVTVATRGQIKTSIPNVAVQSNHSSVIKTILVKEGQEISKGQTLALFDDTLLASDFRNSKQEYEAAEKDYQRVTAELNFISNENYVVPTDPLQASILKGELGNISIKQREHKSRLKELKIERERVEISLKDLNKELEVSIRPQIKTKSDRLNVKLNILNFLENKPFQSPKSSEAQRHFESSLDEIKASLADYDGQISHHQNELQRSYRLSAKRELIAFLQGNKFETPKEKITKDYFDTVLTDIKSAMTDFDVQLAHLEEERARSEQLRKNNIVPIAEYDKKVFDLEKVKLQRDKFVASKIAGYVEEVENLSKTVAGTEHSLKQALTQKDKYLSTQIASHVEELQSLTESLDDLRQRERQLVSDIQNAEIDLNENNLQLEKANLDYDKFVTEKTNDKNNTLKDLLQKKQALSEKILKLSRQFQDVKLLSPVSGTILKLEDKFQGTVIKPGDVVATVVPKNQDFHVEVDIDPADITHVYEGAKVKIMLDALPSQKHGELIGRVSLLSKDTVDEDLAGEKRSVYRAEIDILENKLVKLPDNFQLLPSMNVSGNIISGKRTVMTFLLFPVIKTLETSFREP